MNSKKLYQQNLTLLTDLYQLTMAYGYWKNKLYNQEAVFHLFYRKNPFKGDFAITAGLETVVDYLQNLHFSFEDVRYLYNLTGNDGQPLFDEGFLNYLQRMEFSCDIEAIPEGTVVFPHQPLIRVKGPLIQAQLIETALLNLVNFPTLIATKAARITKAAKGDTVLEFGLRRAQGVDGGLTASRAAYIGGCHATSNVLAGKLYDIPVKGTHAHSWVMCFENELQAFSAYARAMPNNSIFLVDTYNTLEGVQYAIEIGQQMRQRGYEMSGIRLDSGDLGRLSIEARKLLDVAGFPDTQIVASNDLDEYKIKQLKEKGAKITVWGVGTRLATAYDQPALGGVYKLAAIRKKGEKEWKYKIKLSENTIKISNPGILQVQRFYHKNLPCADMFIDESKESPAASIQTFQGNSVAISKDWTSKKLLEPIFKKGKLVPSAFGTKKTNIHAIRARTLEQLALFEKVNLKSYPVGLEETLNNRKLALIEQLRNTSNSFVNQIEN